MILRGRWIGTHSEWHKRRYSVEAGLLPIRVADSCYLGSDPPLQSILAVIDRSELPFSGRIFGGTHWPMIAVQDLGLESVQVPIARFQVLPSNLVFVREGSLMKTYRAALRNPFASASWLAFQSVDAI